MKSLPMCKTSSGVPPMFEAVTLSCIEERTMGRGNWAKRDVPLCKPRQW